MSLNNAENVLAIKDAGLCMGCGSCESICPVEDAIKIELDNAKGIFLPEIDLEKCIKCKLCIKVCPGYDVNLPKLTGKFIEKQFDNQNIGGFNDCFIGFATDDQVRYQGSSGGIASALLIYALENKIIDGALVLGFDRTDVLKTKPYIARTRDDILAYNGSKYIASAINQGVKEILKNEGNYAVVGLPCDLHGIRKMQIINKDLRKKIKFCIGLFCANNNTILGTKYFLHNSGINENEVKKIKYRGLGWPGKYQIELNNGKIVILDRAISEPSFKRKLLISSSFHYDFMIPRCLLCVDHSAELADISLADPWLKEYLFTEKAGKSIIISRNSIGKSIVSLAHQEGVIFIEKIDDFEILNKAQNYRFKAGAGSRIKLRSMIGKAVPNYGKRPLSIKSRALFEYPFYIFSYFSHIPWVRKVLPINSHFRHFVKKVFDKIFI